jgi:hypothetical protein
VVDDLNAICQRRGIGHRFEFQNLRVNATRSETRTYNDEMKEIVFNLFRKDFETYGYDA